MVECYPVRLRPKRCSIWIIHLWTISLLLILLLVTLFAHRLHPSGPFFYLDRAHTSTRNTLLIHIGSNHKLNLNSCLTATAPYLSLICELRTKYPRKMLAFLASRMLTYHAGEHNANNSKFKLSDLGYRPRCGVVTVTINEECRSLLVAHVTCFASHLA
ncbi:hypothetical protein CYLTODRAFT_245444 [Cylindrobasidium torrendii FP15055 ss-10]|uniref:Uncharacterized protein n=1 Tax=Cylindrobasidium torrendii FP15055 ss-10 TaxID=1314674 RepID=A0A0D7BH83_9AGAR|nr:hypothetical protein CYLTODRAFT_245444 [Cylindrobasidium torrendii FP15055 ss-10]